MRCGSPWCRARPGRQGPPPCAEARGAGSPRRRRRGTMPARGRPDLRRRSSWRATATSTGVDMPAPRPGGGGPPRRTRPGRVPETWVPRGRGRREGPERHQAPAVPVPRTPPRRGHRGHVRIPPHACGRSGGVPPETSSREGLGGHRRAKREAGDDSPLLARQAARRAGRDTGLRRAVPRRAGRREVPPALGQGPAAQGGRDEATRAVGEPGLRRHRPRREGQVALLAPRPGEAMRARDAGGVCGPYPEGLPPDTRHGEEPQGARQGARADGGGPRPEADKDTPGQGESTTRGQRAMLPAGAVPELAFRIRQGAVGGCLDLFHVMMSPPDERMGKAACVLDRAMRFPHALRYREYYRKKTSSKGTRSSWEPTTSKGGFLKNFSG